jgi:hypothetical protein
LGKPLCAEKCKIMGTLDANEPFLVGALLLCIYMIISALSMIVTLKLKNAHQVARLHESYHTTQKNVGHQYK